MENRPDLQNSGGPRRATGLPALGAVPWTRDRDDAIEVVWARHQDEVREAQRLRFDVFAREMGARRGTTLPGHDIDLFDDYCEHVLVRDSCTREVIGTCRVLTPAQARRVGGTYTDTEFDLTRLRGLRERMVEIGHTCIHRDHRQGSVLLALWSALAAFMVRNHHDTMVGCASIPMQYEAAHGVVGGGHAAASIWWQLQRTHLAPIEYQVRPRLPLPVHHLETGLAIEAPALIRAYLRMGADILGPPAWDPDFNSADLPMMLRIHDMPQRFRRHFPGA